jgi:iron complex transport system substrate-binding protein
MKAALALILLAAPLFVMTATAQEPSRVLALGGAVTEIAYALGQGDRLIGRDSTSTFPPEAQALPDLGYLRALSPEGVLSVGPDLILADADAGPPQAVAAIEAASVRFVRLPSEETPEGVAAKIRAVAGALDRAEAGEALARRVEGEIRAAAAAAQAGPHPRAIFLLSTEGGRLMAAGEGTGAEAMLRLAGARNALEGFAGYKPVSPEAVLTAAPEVVVMMDRGGSHGGDAAAIFALPGLAGTPAAEAQALVKMDGLFLLGFGPRTGAAVAALHEALTAPHGG